MLPIEPSSRKENLMRDQSLRKIVDHLIKPFIIGIRALFQQTIVLNEFFTCTFNNNVRFSLLLSYASLLCVCDYLLPGCPVLLPNILFKPGSI